MKLEIRLSAVVIALALCPSVASAVVHYVNTNNPAPSAPYTNWNTAATRIQDAVDAADADDQILVTNGTYSVGGRIANASLTNRVVISKPVRVQSVNGPQVTIIC